MTGLESGTVATNVQEARTIDSDNSGVIGIHWLANLRKAFGLQFERRTRMPA